MGKEPTPQNLENIEGDALDLAADDLSEIDPAEFFDPEEFGFRRLKGPITDRPRL
jgi:hypothetical protein